jgi:hypothetical protein
MEVRKALKELPETLDETYERLFLDIPKDDWPYVRTALLWICAHGSLPFKMDIPANILASAVFSPSSLEMSTGQQEQNIATVLDICGCLIRSCRFGNDPKSAVHSTQDQDVVSFKTTSLAHYTVREFLYSDRIKTTNARYFSLSEDGCRSEFLHVVLVTCTRLTSDAFLGYFFENLPRYCREVGRLVSLYWGNLLLGDGKLFDLQLDYMRNPQFGELPAGFESAFYENDDFYPLCSWTLSKLRLLDRFSLVFISLFGSGVFSMCAKILQAMDFATICFNPIELRILDHDFKGTFFEALMEICHIFQTLREGMTKVSLENGQFWLEKAKQELDTESWLAAIVLAHKRGYICHKHFGRGGHHCFLEAALREVPSPNSLNLEMTPLQLAVIREDNHAVQVLLKHGADPNEVGRRGGKKVPTLGTDWGQTSPLRILRSTRSEISQQSLVMD